MLRLFALMFLPVLAGVGSLLFVISASLEHRGRRSGTLYACSGECSAAAPRYVGAASCAGIQRHPLHHWKCTARHRFDPCRNISPGRAFLFSAYGMAWSGHLVVRLAPIPRHEPGRSGKQTVHLSLFFHPSWSFNNDTRSRRGNGNLPGTDCLYLWRDPLILP